MASVCYDTIDRCRGSSAPRQAFTDAFDGVLVTNFWPLIAEVKGRSACAAVQPRERQGFGLV
ncbi:MAG: hypothetical protein V2A79_13610 [Planctomycetota bacterium]